MKTTIVIGSLLVVLLLMLVPSVSAVQYNTTVESLKSKMMNEVLFTVIPVTSVTKYKTVRAQLIEKAQVYLKEHFKISIDIDKQLLYQIITALIVFLIRMILYGKILNKFTQLGIIKSYTIATLFLVFYFIFHCFLPLWLTVYGGGGTVSSS